MGSAGATPRRRQLDRQSSPDESQHQADPAGPRRDGPRLLRADLLGAERSAETCEPLRTAKPEQRTDRPERHRGGATQRASHPQRHPRRDLDARVYARNAADLHTPRRRAPGSVAHARGPTKSWVPYPVPVRDRTSVSSDLAPRRTRRDRLPATQTSQTRSTVRKGVVARPTLARVAYDPGALQQSRFSRPTLGQGQSGNYRPPGRNLGDRVDRIPSNRRRCTRRPSPPCPTDPFPPQGTWSAPLADDRTCRQRHPCGLLD